MTSSASEPMTILSRVERLDLMMGYLEEMRGSRSVMRRSSCTSTASSGTVTSDGGNSSVNSSPKSLEKRCRPIDDVVMETQVKGNLIDRVNLLENRLLQLEEDIENEKNKREAEERSPRSNEKKTQRKGFKSLVKSCVRGNLETKG